MEEDPRSVGGRDPGDVGPGPKDGHAEVRDVLIVPVGGSDDAVVFAVRSAAPRFVAFLASRETVGKIDGIAARLETTISLQRRILVDDPESVNSVYRAVRSHLPGILQEWGVGWDRVLVDITGGTKPMIAGLVLATIHGTSRYQYIGGGRRDRGGAGTVETGHERAILTWNPWDEMATDRIRRFADAFNGVRFAEASRECEEALRVVTDATQKMYLKNLRCLADAFACWDRFDHGRAKSGLESCLGPLRLRWSEGETTRGIPAALDLCRGRLAAIQGSLREEAPSRPLLLDLLANARRRADAESRFDDALARLYRFVEGVAQQALWDRHGILAGKVPVERLPEGPEWDAARLEARRDGSGTAKLPLARSFALLAALGDPAGAYHPRISSGGDLAKLLSIRNASLLAHGSSPVREGTFRCLFSACMEMGEVSETDLVAFPRLPGW